MNNPIIPADTSRSSITDFNELLEIVDKHERVEADRTETINHSKRKADGLLEELEASAYQNAQVLSLLDLNGQLSEKALDKFVNEQALEASKSIPQMLRTEALKRMEQAAEFEAPVFQYADLSQALGVDFPATQYRVEGLVIERQNVLMAAQYKSGKSTLMFNLIKSLCDGDDFLGFKVTPVPDGRTVVYYDFELDESYCINQLRNLEIKHPEKCVVRSLRGHTIPLTTDRAKEWTISDLKGSNADVWIIDPFAAVFTGDENSNTEVNEWLRAVDEIKRKADIQELFLVTHTGRSTEGPTRARGATRLDDWADVRWTWEKVKDEDRKSLTAMGRGVSQEEIQAEWNPKTNVYSQVEITGSDDELTTRVLQYVRNNPGATSSSIKEKVKGKADRIIVSLNQLVEDGILDITELGRSKKYSVSSFLGGR